MEKLQNNSIEIWINQKSDSKNFLSQVLNKYGFSNPTILKTINGKPYLNDDSSFKFNLSHTDNITAIVISKELEVGIDIQIIKPSTKVLDIAERFFHPEEFDYLLKINNPIEQREAFFKIWVRKEAIIKCLGLTIAVYFNQFSVTRALELDTIHVHLLSKPIELFVTELSSEHLPKDAFGVFCTMKNNSPKTNETYKHL